ncbi:MAG: PQQ-binding-like beta-propeller repeat protein [Planctomycetota bacterium]
MRHILRLRAIIVLFVFVNILLPPCRSVRGDGPSEWPQFHGPRRDNKSDETGLLKQWPPGGPTLLWTARGLGHGYSTVAISGGMIYTTGSIVDVTALTALDLNGKVVWTTKNGPAYKRQYPGTRGTPTLDGDRLYHENADGDVVCLDAKTGKTVWGLNILEKFGGRNVHWGMAESLLIDGKNLICSPGGEEAAVVALDKMTGETVWVCKGAGDRLGYSSPIIFTHGGVRQIVTMTHCAVIGVRADTGELLWRSEHATPYHTNIDDPIHHDGCVFITSWTTGSELIRLKAEGARVAAERVWESKGMDNEHGGVILVDGHLYGGFSTIDGETPWVCLEWATGRRKYAEGGFSRCSMTWAEGLFYALNHNRVAALIRATPDSFEIVSRFTIPEGGKGPTWAHPVVCGGRLYIRHGDFLYCYDIQGD